MLRPQLRLDGRTGRTLYLPAGPPPSLTSSGNRPLTAPAGSSAASAAETPFPGDLVQWAKVIDHTRCIGCHACTVACKSENGVPVGVTRTYVKHVEIGLFPEARRAYQVTRCNQCQDAPCVTACPTSAMFRRPDGIVDFDKEACIGCKACIAACPYDAIFINPEDHSAEKCNFCAHRVDMGLEPACVVVCPTEAILVGDLGDPSSRVARLVNRDAVQVRRPEKATRPTLFYKGAHQATLDPLAAERPGGGLFAFAEQPGEARPPAPSNSSAAALLSYDVAHRAPWDFRVSLYTWAKGIAAGAYLVALALALAGVIRWTDPLWLVGAPVLAGAFLALTGAFLVWDLEHPRRFLYIFLRPQWRSWLVRGGVIITAFGLVLLAHFLAGVAGRDGLARVLAWGGLPLAVLSAVYTAYLFAQARARDLWQNPLLPAHFLVQAVLAGASALAIAQLAAGPLLDAGWTGRMALTAGARAHAALLWLVAAASAAHLLLVLGEVTLTHGTEHARRAVWEMTRGRFARYFLAGTALGAVGLFAPWLGLWAAGAALAGLLAFEHAYVQAGQSVPLA